MTYESALTCLADPTRRAVFDRLRAGPLSVGEIAIGMPVSRPAVSQHLKALKDAGLVSDTPVGVRRLYMIDVSGLVDLRRWLDSFWQNALDAFRAEVESKTPRVRRTGSGKGSVDRKRKEGHE